MSLPSRNSNAPWVAGQTVPAADLEFDIAQAHAALADIDDTNVASGANIDGSKLADGTIPTAKLEDAAVTLAKIASGSVANMAVATDVTQQTMGAGVDTNIVTVSMTIGTETPVGVIVFAWGYHQSSTGAHDMVLRRDTTELISITQKNTSSVGTRMIFAIDTPALSTTPDYHLRIENTSGSTGVVYENAQIIAIELRR